MERARDHARLRLRVLVLPDALHVQGAVPPSKRRRRSQARGPDAQSGSRFVRFLTPTSLSYGSADTTRPRGRRCAPRGRTEGAGADAKIFFGTFPSEIRPSTSLRARSRSSAAGRQPDDRDRRTVRVRPASSRRRGADTPSMTSCARSSSRSCRHSVPTSTSSSGSPAREEPIASASMRLAERLVSMGARIHSHAFMPLPGTPLRDATPSPIEPETMPRWPASSRRAGLRPVAEAARDCRKPRPRAARPRTCRKVERR